MPAATPLDALSQFAAHLAAGELDAAMELYEDDAAFLPDPGTVASGAPAVRAALEGFFALRPTLRWTDPRVLAAGDLVLVVHAWTLSGTQPDGSPLELQGRGIDVLRRQSDGTWRYVVDNPWGTTLLDVDTSAPPDHE